MALYFAKNNWKDITIAFPVVPAPHFVNNITKNLLPHVDFLGVLVENVEAVLVLQQCLPSPVNVKLLVCYF